MEEAVYSYNLEVQEDGNLWAVTEYLNGYVTMFPANATIEDEGVIYFIYLYE